MDQGRPLRVMQLGPTMWRGGVASSIRSMCVELVRRGHDVTLVADGGDAAQGIESTGVQYEEVVWSHRPGQLVGTVRRVRAAISQFRPDIVHVHGRSQALAAHLARRAADWFTLHSTALTDQVGVLDRGVARRHLSPLGRRCFALNDEAATYLRRQLNVPEDRIRVVPNGVDCTRFRPPSRAERATARATFGLDERSLLVVCVGRLEQEKQPLAVVELAKAAADAGIADAKFVFVGDGRLATTIDERIAGLGVTDTCHRAGWMDARFAYWAADLLVMPSLYEGYGLVAAESMACGTPALRTESGGHELMIVDGENGFLCSTDVDDFVARGVEVLGSPDRLRAMRERTRELAEERVSIAAQIDMTLAAYRESLAEREIAARS